MSDCDELETLYPLAFGTVNEVQRPLVCGGDVIRIYVRAERIIDGFAGWETGRNDGVQGNRIGILIGDLLTPLGRDGFASLDVSSFEGRPIVCPTYQGLGANLIVDLSAMPVDTNGEAWVHVLPKKDRFWGV